MKRELKQLEKDLQLLRRINSKTFDVEHRVFLRLEEEMEKIIEWAKIPREKRKPAVINWTSSPQRKIGYLIENLESSVPEKGVQNEM